MTLDEAKTYVEQNLDSGTTCPCCGQTCKLYARSIHTDMAKWLIYLVKEFERTATWVDVKTSAVRGGDYAKLVYWGLIERQSDYYRIQSATAGRTGLWKPTETGVLFARGEISTNKYAYVFDDTVYRYSAETITIHEALGREFSFDEVWG